MTIDLASDMDVQIKAMKAMESSGFIFDMFSQDCWEQRFFHLDGNKKKGGCSTYLLKFDISIKFEAI